MCTGGGVAYLRRRAQERQQLREVERDDVHEQRRDEQIRNDSPGYRQLHKPVREIREEDVREDDEGKVNERVAAEERERRVRARRALAQKQDLGGANLGNRLEVASDGVEEGEVEDGDDVIAGGRGQVGVDVEHALGELPLAEEDAAGEGADDDVFGDLRANVGGVAGVGEGGAGEEGGEGADE